MYDGRSQGKVLCTQQQRLARIDEMCERYHRTHATQASQDAFIDNMTDAEIVRFSKYNLHLLKIT